MKSMNEIISANLKALRKNHKLSQEQVAEEIGVSRQALAKWESGESLPDIDNCYKLTIVYKTSFDALTTDYLGEANDIESAELLKDSYFFGVAKVNERGQIVIPKSARKVYDINYGDRLLIVGDKRGLGMAKLKGMLPFVKDEE